MKLAGFEALLQDFYFKSCRTQRHDLQVVDFPSKVSSSRAAATSKERDTRHIVVQNTLKAFSSFINGTINRNNDRYCADSNPHIFYELHTQHPQKLNVWVDIFGDHIVDALFSIPFWLTLSNMTTINGRIIRYFNTIIVLLFFACSAVFRSKLSGLRDEVLLNDPCDYHSFLL